MLRVLNIPGIYCAPAPDFGPSPIRLPVNSSSETSFKRFGAANWNGESYIGKIARIDRCSVPFAQPVPDHASSASPIVTSPSVALCCSSNTMF